MKILGRIVLTLGLLAAAIASMFAYRPAGAEAALSLIVTADRLNVRQGPGIGYAVTTVLQSGGQATAVARDVTGAWYEVQLANGSTGWLSATYVRVSGDPATLPQAAAPSNGQATPGSATAGHIAFQTSSGGAIYIMPAPDSQDQVNPDGSGLRFLTTGMDPALSPDGRQVAFTRWDGGSGDGALGSVWVINVDGTGERKVEGDVRQPKSPTWSPDGTQLIIQVQQGGTIQDTWTCIVNGKPEDNLPQPIPGAACRPSPANPWWGLRLIDLSDGSFQDLPRAAHSFSPTWDPANPNLVVFHGDQGLMAVDLSQKTTYPLDTNVDQRTPAFSPDGSRLAVSYKQDNHWEVHVLNADGSGDTRLTETPLTVLVQQELQGKTATSWNNAAPAWSPDGKQIVFLTDRNGQWEIWAMNADGSAQRPLLAGPAAARLNIQYNGVDERVLSWR